MRLSLHDAGTGAFPSPLRQGRARRPPTFSQGMNNRDLAETIGIVCGIILTLVVFVLPLVMNALALRHRGINRRCALSVLFTMGGTIVAGVLAKLMQTSGMSSFMLVIPALLALGSYVTGTVLAIVGLREIRRRRGRYRGGKRRAIAMLFVNAVYVLLFAFGIYTAMTRSSSLAGIGPAGQEVRNEEWNFRLAPPPEWVPLDGSKFNPLYRAMFMRKRPEMFIAVIAEQAQAGSAINLAASVELVKAQLQAKPGTQITADEAQTVNAYVGHRIESEEQSGAVRFFNVHWVYVNNGTLYRVAAWGAPEQSEFIRAESAKVRTGFHILDPKLTVRPAATRNESEFRSEHFGYTVNLRDSPWTRRWETLEKDNPFAEFGVQNAAANACFLVIPVALGEVELEKDVLTRALAARVGVPFPNAGVSGLKDWTQGAPEGQAFSFERKTNEATFVFRLRALSGRGFAYLLAAWADKRALASGDFLEQALDRVSFSGAAPVLPRELEPRTDRDRLAQSLVCNDIGLALDAAGHPDQGLPWFLRAVKFSPRDVPFLTNAIEMWLKLGRPADALALLDRNLPNFPGDQKLAGMRARVLLLTGDSAGAEKSLAALLDAGWHDDAQFGEYVKTLCERGYSAAALAAIERYARGADTPVLLRMRAVVFQFQKDYDKAIATLLEARKAAPEDANTTFALAEAYSTAQRYSDSIAEYVRLISARQDSAPVLQRKGVAEFSLKRYRDAKATFEQALNKDPENAEIKRILDHVSGLLGEADNSSVRKPIEPVAIPAPLLAETPPSADAADSGAAYRRDVRAIEFVKGGEFRTTDFATIAVRDAQGVARFGTLDFRFDPLAEEIFVNSLIVKNANGEPAGTARVEDSYVVSDGTGDAAAQRKILQVPVPGLQPGCTIEYTVTRRGTGTPNDFPFRSHSFSRALPVSRSVLFVKAPADALKWEAAPGVPEPKRGDGGLTWIVDAPPVHRMEPLQAQPDTFLPTVWLGSPAATWPGVAKDYLAEIKDRLPIDAGVRAAADAALSGLEKNADKTAALARFVQRELTYKPLEFGRLSRVPNPASQILRDKSGDSKDHALLLAQLLESASIPARLALVSSDATVRQGLPSLDQFDHMIVFIPAGESGAFIDCTGKTGDVRKSPPPGLATGRALILDPDRPRLVTIPDLPAGASSVGVKRDISFTNETDADIRESVTFDGASAQSLRASLLSVEAVQRNAAVHQTILREVPGAVLTEVRIDALDDPQRPLKIETRYLLRGRFNQAGGQLTGRLPCSWERLFLRADPMEKRASPFRLAVPLQIESRTTLTPPTGHLCTATALRPIENAFDHATATSRIDANKLVIEARITRRNGQFPAAQYRALADAANASIGIIEQNIVLQKPGAR